MSGGNELHVIFGMGPVGLAVMDELLARGQRVRVVKRSGQANLPEEVEVVKGDATDPANTREVCKGATHIYNCTNAPDYHKWPEQFPPLQAGVLEGAAANDAKLIVMENLYMYGPHGGEPLTENTPMKGKGLRSSTRKQMALDLMAAHTSGKVRATAGRASDFFGPRVGESMAGERVFKPAVAGEKVQLLLHPDLPHTFTYVPDIGKALVLLGQRDEALGQAWHIPSPTTITPREFVTRVCQEAGQPVNISAMPKLMLQLLLPLIELMMPPMRGISENTYMFFEPYTVDHSQFNQTFGDAMQPTPLDEAIRTTVQWYQENSV